MVLSSCKFEGDVILFKVSGRLTISFCQAQFKLAILVATETELALISLFPPPTPPFRVLILMKTASNEKPCFLKLISQVQLSFIKKNSQTNQMIKMIKSNYQMSKWSKKTINQLIKLLISKWSNNQMIKLIKNWSNGQMDQSIKLVK